MDSQDCSKRGNSCGKITTHFLFKFSPRPLSSFEGSFFLSSLAMEPRLELSSTGYNIIHDFNTGLQFTVIDRRANCSVEPIRAGPKSDAAALDSGQAVRLRLARELLEVSPGKFKYSGQRFIRSILVNVWTAERLGENFEDPYSTIELFFSHEDYNMESPGGKLIKNMPVR